MEHQSENNKVLQFKDGGVVKADTDEGYTRIANTLLESIYRCELTGRQLRVYLALVRKTYGYQRKTDYITASQIAAEINYQSCESNIRADLKILKDRKLIISEGRKIGPNPIISEWVNSVENNTQKCRKQQCRKQHTTVLKSTRQSVENNTPRVLKTTHTKESIKENKKESNLNKGERHPAHAESDNPPIDFSALNFTDEQISEVKRIRKKNSKTAKEAQLSQRIVNGLAKEFHAAEGMGFSVDDLLTEWEIRGWTGFKAEWIKPKSNQPQALNNNQASAQAWLQRKARERGEL